MNTRMRDQSFTAVVYAATFALGWYVLADGVRGLVT